MTGAMSRNKIQRVVQAGGRHFDTVKPGWFAEIDADKIDVSDSFLPPIAALGEAWDENIALNTAREIGLFFGDQTDDARALATALWRYETRKRQNEAAQGKKIPQTV